jgi:hypothetical protein
VTGPQGDPRGPEVRAAAGEAELTLALA